MLYFPMQVAYMGGYIIICEMVAKQHRGPFAMACTIPWAIATSILPLITYYLPSAKAMTLAISIPNFLFAGQYPFSIRNWPLFHTFPFFQLPFSFFIRNPPFSLPIAHCMCHSSFAIRHLPFAIFIRHSPFSFAIRHFHLQFPIFISNRTFYLPFAIHHSPALFAIHNFHSPFSFAIHHFHLPFAIFIRCVIWA